MANTAVARGLLQGYINFKDRQKQNQQDEFKIRQQEVALNQKKEQFNTEQKIRELKLKQLESDPANDPSFIATQKNLMKQRSKFFEQAFKTQQAKQQSQLTMINRERQGLEMQGDAFSKGIQIGGKLFEPDMGEFMSTGKQELTEITPKIAQERRDAQLPQAINKLVGDQDLSKASPDALQHQRRQLIRAGYSPDLVDEQLEARSGKSFKPKEASGFDKFATAQLVSSGAITPEEGRELAGFPPTKYTVSPTGKVVQSEESKTAQDLFKEGEKTELKAGIKQVSEQTKQFLKSNQDLTRVSNAFSELVSFGKQATNEQGGFGKFPALKGKIGQSIAQLKSGIIDVPPEEQFSGMGKYVGQLQEVTLALSPILTGQNRVLQSTLKMIAKTLPDLTKGITETQFTGQLKQSLRNSFRLSLGFSKTLQDRDTVERLNQADQKTIDAKLKNILNSTRLTDKEEKLFDDLWKQIKKTPASKPETLEDEDMDSKINSLLDQLGG